MCLTNDAFRYNGFDGNCDATAKSSDESNAPNLAKMGNGRIIGLQKLIANNVLVG